MPATSQPRIESAAVAPYRRGDLRAAFVEGALVMLREAGAERFSLNELARRLGVSPAAAYRHFAGKEALLTAVCATGYDSLRQTLNQPWPEGMTAGERVRQLGVRYLRFAAEHDDLFAIMFGPRSSSAEIVGADTFTPLLDAVAIAQAESVIPPGDVRMISRAIWSTLHGMAVLHRSGSFDALGLDDNVDRLVRSTFSILLPGLAADDPRPAARSGTRQAT